jgi:hypothetical protein
MGNNALNSLCGCKENEESENQKVKNIFLIIDFLL